jgi:hypothetical protein
MIPADRDRLVTLKKAKKKLIRQPEAAEELGLSLRQVKRLPCGLKKRATKPWSAGWAGGVQPQNRGGDRAGSGEDSVGASVSRIRTDAGGGVFGKETQESKPAGRRCAAVFERGESEAVVELLGEIRSAADVLTDKASLFRTAEKHQRSEPGVEKDAVEMPPTQIGRAARELWTTWISASQRAGGVEFRIGARSAGRGNAGERGEDNRSSQ